MKSFLAWVSLALVLTACATTPHEISLPASGVRVISFAADRDVHDGGRNGPVEARPGVLSLGKEGFDEALMAALERAWNAFPEQAARQFGVEVWEGPGDEASHPAWVEASSGPISQISVDYRRARGFFWPKTFRFVESTGVALSAVAAEYPGQLLLTVEYVLFGENTGQTTEFRYPDFRLGVSARLTLYGTDGVVASQTSVVGYSKSTAPRRGKTLDRSRFADFIVEAQADVLEQWSRRVQLIR